MNGDQSGNRERTLRRLKWKVLYPRILDAAERLEAQALSLVSSQAREPHRSLHKWFARTLADEILLGLAPSELDGFVAKDVAWEVNKFSEREARR